MGDYSFDEFSKKYKEYEENFKKQCETREKEMLACHHWLVKTKQGQYVGSFHSSDCGTDPSIVTCVKCGFTNRYYSDDYERQTFRGITNNKVFKIQFGEGWCRGGKSFSDTVFDKYLMSKNEVIPVWYPERIFTIAKLIEPNGTKKEMFEIIKRLYEIMTDQERFHLLFTPEQVEDIINRYKEQNTLTLKMKPKVRN